MNIGQLLNFCFFGESVEHSSSSVSVHRQCGRANVLFSRSGQVSAGGDDGTAHTYTQVVSFLQSVSLSAPSCAIM